MEKQVAITILEDIYSSLQEYDWKEKGLKTIDIYKKNLEIATNKKIQELIEKQNECVRKYGENGRKTIALNKKIDKEIARINNK